MKKISIKIDPSLSIKDVNQEVALFIYKWRKNNAVKATCKNCGKKILVNQIHKIPMYCSVTCRVYAFYKRNPRQANKSRHLNLR